VLAILQDGVTREYVFKPRVRISLLGTHGGLWADASLLCMQPIGWLADAVVPSGFWSYRDEHELPCSWVLAATNGSCIMRRWHEAVDSFWTSVPKNYPYFWMYQLFRKLLSQDEQFNLDWSLVSNKESCDIEGGASSAFGGER
jgi:hypothetical protein